MKKLALIFSSLAIGFTTIAQTMEKGYYDYLSKDTCKSCYNHYPASVPTVKSPDEVIIYPNPAANEVNVVFDGNQDIKTVSIHNRIGKPVSVFKVAGDSANLNIENIPKGIYFISLINSHGDVVQTRKFTKQ
jgi:hypothetical protein